MTESLDRIKQHSTALPRVEPITPSTRGEMLVEADSSLREVIRKLTG